MKTTLMILSMVWHMMLADVAEVEGLEVAEMHGVEQHQYRHHLAVGKTARTDFTPTTFWTLFLRRTHVILSGSK